MHLLPHDEPSDLGRGVDAVSLPYPEEPVEFTNGRDVICLECWRSLYPDFLHLDCTGEHVVPKAEADELRVWLNGRYAWMVATRQARLLA